MQDGRRLITEYYYYMDINQLNHTLQVVNIKDFLGVLGGIFGLLMNLSKWIIGSYVSFEAQLRWIKKFYKFKTNDKNNYFLSELVKGDDRFDLRQISILGTYLIHHSSMSKCFKCCYTKRQKLINKIIDKGNQQLNKDFDFNTIINRKNKCDYETMLYHGGLLNKKEPGQDHGRVLFVDEDTKKPGLFSNILSHGSKLKENELRDSQ